jgi:phage anti-repressor protein
MQRNPKINKNGVDQRDNLVEFINYVRGLDNYSDDDNRAIKLAFFQKFLPAISGNNDFTIKLVDVAQWLDMMEWNLRKTLIRTYVNGRDYRIIRRKITGGRPREDIYLTTDTVQRLLLQSRSRNAEQVRTYFITMESMYREFMMHKIQDRSKLEDETVRSKKILVLKPFPKQFPVGHCVYVIQVANGSNIRYKIGRTKDLNRRAREHWFTLPGFVKVIYHKLCADEFFLETCAHAGLRKLEIENEIFITNPTKIIETLEFCTKMYTDLCNFTKKCK